MTSLLAEHHCDALVLHCIDFRFHGAIRSFLVNERHLASYDLLTIPGAAKHLTSAGSPERKKGLLEDIAISLRLHEPRQIVIINHVDCGAYGGRAAFSSEQEEASAHRAALAEAVATLQQNFPGKDIVGFLADIREGTVAVVA